MHRLRGKYQKKLMPQKFYSMLLGGSLTMVMVSVMLMSDSIIAGAILGSNAIAGITLVTPMYSLAAFFASIFSLGVPIIYAIEMGKFRKHKADQAFGFGLLMCIVVGVLLFFLSTFFGDLYLRSSNPSEAVLKEARDYLFWIRFTILLIPLQMLINSMVYSDGDEMLSTGATAVQGIGNICASVILGYLMGIRGIGLASFLFNVISLAILLAHFSKKNNSLKLNLYFSMELVKSAVNYSIIDSSSYLFIAILISTLNTFVSTRFGAQFLPIVSIVTLCRELQMVFDGIGEALKSIMSVYVGEGCGEGVKAIYKIAKKTAIVEGFVVMIALIVCGQWVPMVLNIENPVVSQYAVTGIRILSLGSIFVSLLYLLSSYYLLIKKIMLGLLVSLFRDVLLSVLLSLGLGSAFGPIGMFVGLAIAPAAAYVLLLLLLTGQYGRKDTPLLISTLSFHEKNYLFDLETEPEQIIGLQKKVEALLIENDVDQKTVNCIKLLIEDLYMLIREKNGGKAILSECSVTLFSEGIQIVSRDEGALFDISEDDVKADSVVSLVFSGYMENMVENRQYLTTTSFNRSAFLIKPYT